MKKYIKPIVNIFNVQAKHNMLVVSKTLDVMNDPADVDKEILSKEDNNDNDESLFGW